LRSFAWVSYFQYFLSGLVITTLGSVLPQLLAHYGASYTDGGRLVFLGSAGFLVGVPLSALLLQRLSEKAVMSAAAAMIAIGQLGIFLLPSFGFVSVLHFVDSAGVGILETIVATLMMEVFIGRRAVVMSYLEVSFGLGAFIMPMAASLMIAFGVWRYAFAFTGVLAVFMVLAWGKITYAKVEADLTGSMDASTTAPQPMSRRTKGLALALFVFLIFMYSGVEGSLNNFLSSVFISYLGEIPYYAPLSIGLYWTAMVAGRVATGWLIRKVTYGRFLLCSMLITLLCLCCFIMGQDVVVGYMTVILMGLAMSGVYSITMVYANHTFPGMARLVTSIITLFAGLGGAIFPALIGYSMDHAGMKSSLWVVACFAGLYVVGLLLILSLYGRMNRRVSQDVRTAHSLM
jgi:FHS family glucose/mannose:H+ symporter-like MFS transporter